MKHYVKEMIFLIGLGASLVAYAYTNFSTKSDYQDLRDQFKQMRKDTRDDLHEIKEDVRFIRAKVK